MASFKEQINKKTGKKEYRCRYYFYRDGKKRDSHTGWFPTKEEAEAEAKRLAKEKTEAEANTVLQRRDKQGTTALEEVIEEYDKKSTRETTWETLLKTVEPDCVPLPDVWGETAGTAFIENRIQITGIKNAESFFATVCGYTVAIYNYSETSVISVYTSDILVPFVTKWDNEYRISDFLSYQTEQLKNNRNIKIKAQTGEDRALDASPDILFAYENFRKEENEQEEKIKIEVKKENEDEFGIRLSYRKDCYTDIFMQRFLDSYIHFTKELSTKESMSEISLLNNDEKAKLDSFNNTRVPYDKSKTIIQQFCDSAKKFPDNKAVITPDTGISYQELDQLTDNLAEYLKQCGIAENPYVGILVPRNEYMVISAIAVLKAGGAYLPLDPDYPQERLEYMLEDANACILICDKFYQDKFTNFNGRRITTEEIRTLPDAAPVSEERHKDSPLVVLYTSGTTGKPKGVIITERNMRAFSAFTRHLYQMDETFVSGQYASFGFDAFTMDVFPALTCGAGVCIVPAEMRLDLQDVFQYFRNNKVTHCAMTTQIARQFASLGNTGYLRGIVTGGEKLVSLTPPDYPFMNAYGPSECTVMISYFTVDRVMPEIPIGKPIDNIKLYVVNKEGKRVPCGAVGELWASGEQVAKGYLNNAEKTAEVFIRNTFESDEEYQTIYKTGDLVRYLPDGNLQFVGRKDKQVKVRGFRVEPSEIEEIIRRFPEIKDTVVADFDDPAGGKYLAGYVVSHTKIDFKKLKEYIGKEKPAYMIPAVFMQIDEIPYTQNQKVDKRRLPVPERAMDDILETENEEQEKIVKCAEIILGHRSFTLDTSLMDAGLTSIGMIQLAISLGDTFSIPVKIGDIRENDTIRKLENFLCNTEKEVVYELQDEYPITQTQNGIFVSSSSETNSTAYNIPVVIWLDENVDLQKLEQAVQMAISAHPYIFATLFSNEKGEIRAKRNAETKIQIEKIKTKTLPEESALVRPYKMLDEKLYRAEIYQTDEGNVLFLDFHHIIADGTSMGVLLNDISKAYQGEEIKKETYTGYEIALEEERERKTGKYEKAKLWYKENFSGIETNCLPPKAAEANTRQARLFRRTFHIKKTETETFCKDKSVSLNAFFNTAFGLTLSKFTLSESVTYTTVYNGRSDSRSSNTFCMLVKTVPMTMTPKAENSVQNMLKQTQQMLLDNMENDIFSFAEIAAELGIRSDIMFAYQGDQFNFDTLCGSPAKVKEIPSKNTKAPITVTMFAEEDGFYCDAEYRPDMYSAPFMESFVETLETVAAEMLQKTEIKDIQFVSENQRQIIDEANKTNKEFIDIPVHKLFEQYAEKTPNKLAIACNGEKLSYQELNERANSIAAELQDCQLKANSVVGVLLERTVDIVAAELGIMKAGGAFLGMLPSYPDDRLDFCLQDAQSPYIISTEEIIKAKANMFTADKPYKAIALETIYDQKPDKKIVRQKETEDNKNQLAYCIYTSGTTGRPKGVMVSHHGLANLAQQDGASLDVYFGSKGGDVSLAMSSISFDMSLLENLLFLLNGKSVVMATEEEIHNPGRLAALITENQVDTLTATPSFLTNYIDIPEFAASLSNIKTFLVGAEKFPAQLAEKIRAISSDAHILNGYGPSECTICSSAIEITETDNITIGKPNLNTKYYVFDKQGRLLPPYGCGELIIGGACVGLGYMNLPEKTKEAFFIYNGEDAYHSGDVVRMTENGEIQCIGRMDDQIKLRGFRIELGEIEKAISAFEGIQSSKVIVRNNGAEDYLAGFFTADREIDIAKLQDSLRASLNYYMVPDVMMQLDKIPLTQSGKLDTKALPETTKPRKQKKEARRQRKSTEDIIIDIFADVLSDDEISYDDNFFELGGTSLSASRVIMQLLTKGYDVEYQNIFEHPTPEELADYLDANKKNDQETAEKEMSGTKAAGIEYEYTDVLQYNTLQYATNISRKPLGNVLLTGGVGFLGIHVFRELLEKKEGNIVCLVRSKEATTPDRRLRAMLMYYFGQTFEEEIQKRVTIVNDDITNDELSEVLADMPVDTIINCAAIVKHFAADDSIEYVNTHGVENLIRYAEKTNARLIQISTASTPGVHTEETYRQRIRMHENELFLIESLDNKYLLSKYHAEQKMFEAIRNGLDGKVIRVGNLMGRHSDGEFQVNMNTNAFLSTLRSFSAIKKFPLGHSTDAVSLSPIDLTAKAIVLLAGTDKKFTAFHADSRSIFDEIQIIETCNRCGIPIKAVEDKEFNNAYMEFLGDKEKNKLISGLVTTERADIHAVETDNAFTANVLYQLGFMWPLTDEGYLDRAIQALKTLDFFD